MTTKDLERMIGEKVPAKREFQLIGDRLLHREEDDWHEYDPYPVPKEDIDGN